MLTGPDSTNAIQELLELSDPLRLKIRPPTLATTPLSSSRWQEQPSLVYIHPNAGKNTPHLLPASPFLSPQAVSAYQALSSRSTKPVRGKGFLPPQCQGSKRMLMSSIVTQDEQSSWKVFKDFKLAPTEIPQTSRVRKKPILPRKDIRCLSQMRERAVNSTFSPQNTNRDLPLERKGSRENLQAASTPGWKQERRNGDTTEEQAKTPRTPLFSSFTPRLQSDYEALSPMDDPATHQAVIDIQPPKIVFGENERKPVCYKFATTLKALKKPPTQQSFDRAPSSPHKKRMTDRKTSIDSRIDKDPPKHSRFHTFYGYPQFILMNESEDDIPETQLTERDTSREDSPGNIKKLFQNNALRTITKQNQEIYQSQEVSTPGRGSIDSSFNETGYLANKRFLSSRASPTPGELVHGEQKSPRSTRGTPYFSKGMASQRGQMSKTFIGFHFDEASVKGDLLPDATHPHLKALPKKSCTPLPRPKNQRFSIALQESRDAAKVEAERKERRKTERKQKKEFQFKSPKVFLNSLKKKEEMRSEEEIEANKLILDLKKARRFNSSSPVRTQGPGDFRVRAPPLHSRGRKALPQVSEKRNVSLLTKQPLLLKKSEDRNYEINKTYNDLLMETQRARELFPYFSKGDKFNELVQHKSKETFAQMKEDPILNMTRAQLPGLTPLLRRLRAISPLTLMKK